MKAQAFLAASTIILLVSVNGSLQATEIRGKVTAVDKTSVTIAVEGELSPNVEDPITVYFTLPGTGDEVVVGTGKVTAVAGNIVTAKMIESPGTPDKDQLVRISSAHPRPRTESPPVSPSPGSVPITPAPSTTAGPAPASRGPSLFTHNFETAAPITTALFGAKTMTSRNVDGEGELTGRAPGILPAFFGKLLLNDFILECDVRAEQVPASSSYGFVFRSAEVKNGAVSAYYGLLLDPNRKVVIMNCWKDGKWMMNAEQPIPEGTLLPGQKQRIALEVRGSQFVVFIGGKFAAKFSDSNLTDGRIGLCLNSANADQWSAYFDNFSVFLFPKDSAAAASPDSSWPGRVWDFSSGKTKPLRSETVELVDGKVWGMKGHHLRFLQAGASWLEATFTVPDSSRPNPGQPYQLQIEHLASSPDGKKNGYAPVRITLNGKEIFNESPSQMKWMQSRVELGDSLRPGTNTLRWEYRKDATTHYWLRSFAISPSSTAASITAPPSPSRAPVYTTPPNSIPELGTAASYNCDDGSGDVLTDSSNNGRPMKLFGGLKFGPGKSGKALDFKDSTKLFARRDKDDAILNLDDRDFLIELFVNFRAFHHEQVLLEKFSGGGGPGWTFTLLDESKLHFFTKGAGAFTASVNLKPGRWYRFAVERRESRLRIFVDDSALLDQPINGAIAASSNPLLLGCRNPEDGRAFSVDGLIDDVRIDVVPPRRE